MALNDYALRTVAEVRAVLRLLSMIESPVNKIRRDAALTLLTLLNRQSPDPLQLLFRPELARGPWEGAPQDPMGDVETAIRGGRAIIQQLVYRLPSGSAAGYEAGEYFAIFGGSTPLMPAYVNMDGPGEGWVGD